MNHPSREDLVSHVYKETRGEQRAFIEEHLRECHPCRETVSKWQATSEHLRLFGDTAATSPGKSHGRTQWLPWSAAAAALALAVGVWLGRSSSSDETGLQRARIDFQKQCVAKARADVFADLQAALTATNPEVLSPVQRALQNQLAGQAKLAASRLRTELTEEFQSILESGHNRSQEQFARAATILEAIRQESKSDYDRLRKAVETVAYVAEERFTDTENQIGLIAFSSPNAVPNSSSNPTSFP